ncbi:hypothetical protein AMECASPLE_021498 [Ameca splendens]|uniref:Chemokine interleukin-8-like domain-containing protein n=1 Tax=Ameca splendens TaxID=208324 RepID=A0ABV0XSI8_9TELE
MHPTFRRQTREFPSLESPTPDGWGRSTGIKRQHVARKHSVEARLVFSMPLNLQTVCQFTLLSLCCLLTAVRKTDSTYVPGRCLCPKSETGVRGKLTDLKIYPKSATCSNITVIVTLKSNNVNVCLNPEAALGKQLIRCWNRAQKLGRDVKLCLRRRRRRGGHRQRPQQKARRHTRRTSSSKSH